MEYVVYSKPDCGHCVLMKQLIKDSGHSYTEINMPDLDIIDRKKLMADARLNKQTMMPIVYINNEFIRNDVLEKELEERIWINGLCD